MSGSSFISLWNLWGLGSIVLSLSSIVYYWRSTITRIPASIPWAGVKDEAFSKPRAWIREITAGLSTLHEGYFTHNQKGKPFVLLDTAGRPNIILPKEQSRWLVGQPDHILNSRKVINTRFAIDYLSPHIRQELDSGMNLAIRRDLTRNLGRTQKVSFDTIRALVDQLMGLNHDTYIQVNLDDVIGPVVSGVSNRMLVGDVLYHTKGFRKSLASFGNILGLGSLLIGQFAPFFVRPVVGFVAGVVVRVYRRRALKFMVPAARERINNIKRKKEDPGWEYEAPLDIMQWVILACPDGSAEEIAAVILSLALGATHTSVIISTGTLLELLSSPPELGYYEKIAEEAASVFQTEEDFGNLQSLHKLSRIDSAIRESMRCNPLTGRGLMKEVMQPNGVTLPDGQKIPLGAWLGVSLTGVHQDENFYPDPHIYDPFRFSRARTEIALIESNGKNRKTDSAATTTITTNKAVISEQSGIDVDYSTEPGIGKVLNGSADLDYSTEPVIGKVNGTADHNKLNGSWLSTTAEDFGTFGFGRHSCPGRWFASHVMKMTLAYIALNYEIQPIDDRPPNLIIGDMIVPPQNVMIKVRRRKILV